MEEERKGFAFWSNLENVGSVERRRKSFIIKLKVGVSSDFGVYIESPQLKKVVRGTDRQNSDYLGNFYSFSSDANKSTRPPEQHQT